MPTPSKSERFPVFAVGLWVLPNPRCCPLRTGASCCVELSQCPHTSVANDGKAEQFAVSHPASNTEEKIGAFQIKVQMM